MRSTVGESPLAPVTDIRGTHFLLGTRLVAVYVCVCVLGSWLASLGGRPSGRGILRGGRAAFN